MATLKGVFDKIWAYIIYDPATVKPKTAKTPVSRVPAWMDLDKLTGPELDTAIQLGYVRERNLTTEQHARYMGSLATIEHVIQRSA